MRPDSLRHKSHNVIGEHGLRDVTLVRQMAALARALAHDRHVVLYVLVSLHVAYLALEFLLRSADGRIACTAVAMYSSKTDAKDGFEASIFNAKAK